MKKKITPFEWFLAITLLIGLALFFGNCRVGRTLMLECSFLLAAVSFICLMRRRAPMSAARWAVILAVFQCLIVYLWYESAGTMSHIPSTYYYVAQTNAFLQGRLALLEVPNPELFKLSDPYDPVQNAPYRIHDASFYKGKYYLYWGPFPALLLAVPKLLGETLISDSMLVLLFMAGYVIFLALILSLIRATYFPALPSWTTVPAILVGGLMNPTLWLLARPAVYEAAISGGQCCAIGGFYFAFSALRGKDVKSGKLAVSGILLACAALSRISLALAIVWAAACIAYAIHRRTESRRHARKALFAFGTPLVVMGLLFFSYNFLRFDSPFEVGMKYTLGGMNTKKMVDEGFLTSTRNVFPNMETYLFFPTVPVSGFPFVTAPPSGYSAVEKAMNSHGQSTYAVSENIAGVMITSPVFWCLVVQILFSMIRSFFRKNVSSSGQSVNIAWPSLLFAGFGILAFAPLSLSFTSSMRYIFDFAPMMFLLTYLRMGYQYSNSATRIEKVLWSMGIPALGAITVIYGLLLGINSYYGSFPVNNPALFDRLARAFSIFNR